MQVVPGVWLYLATLNTLASAMTEILGTSIAAGRRGAALGPGEGTPVPPYSREFEEEADYLALYILARGGFALEEAPALWKRLARYASATSVALAQAHPISPERLARQISAIEEIKDKIAAKRRLNPDPRRLAPPMPDHRTARRRKN